MKNKDEFGEVKGLKTRTELQDEFRTHPRRWFRWLYERLEIAPHTRLLELGCGAGVLWSENLERLPEGARFTLTDLSGRMLREAYGGLAGRGIFSYAVCDAGALPFPDAQFDLALGIGVLDLVPDLRKVLGEVQRSLKPGGRFFATAGGRAHLLELEALARPFLPQAGYGGASERFGLENGAAILSTWFHPVELSSYSGELVFVEPDSLLAYILSEREASADLPGNRREGLRRSLESILAKNGEIRVKVEKGVFKARKIVGQ